MMDDDEMDVDFIPQPTQTFYAWPPNIRNSPSHMDHVRWECSQPTSPALASLLNEAAANRATPRVPRTGATPLSEHSFSTLSSHSSESTSLPKTTLTVRTRSRLTRPRQAGSSAASSHAPMLVPDPATWDALTKKAAMETDLTAYQRKEYMERKAAKARERAEGKINFACTTQNKVLHAQSRLPAKAAASSSSGSTSNHGDVSMAGTSSSDDSASPLDGRGDILSYMTPPTRAPSRAPTNPLRASRTNQSFEADKRLSKRPLRLSRSDSEPFGSELLRHSTPSPPAESPLSLVEKPMSAAPITPPAEAVVCSRIAVAPTANIAVHTPLGARSQISPGPRPLGMRPISYSAASSSQLTPSQTLPTKQKPFKTPFAKPPPQRGREAAPLVMTARASTEVISKATLITPDATPRPRAAARASYAISRPPQKQIAKRSPSPGAEANSSFGELEMPFSFEVLDAEMRKYD